jgi:hypothetical protein
LRCIRIWTASLLSDLEPLELLRGLIKLVGGGGTRLLAPTWSGH